MGCVYEVNLTIYYISYTISFIWYYMQVTNYSFLVANLSSRGRTSVRRADPGSVQEQRTRGSPREDGCRRREGSAEWHHQSLRVWSPAAKTHVPPQCSLAATEQGLDPEKRYTSTPTGSDSDPAFTIFNSAPRDHGDVSKSILISHLKKNLDQRILTIFN